MKNSVFAVAAMAAGILVAGMFCTAKAGPVSFGLSTAGSLTLTADSNVCDLYGHCSPGFYLYGSVFGSDSNGSSYALYVSSGLAYFSSNPAQLTNPPANQWYWFEGTFLNLYDTGLAGNGADIYNSSGIEVQQDTTGLITLLYQDVNTNGTQQGLVNYIFDLQVDPAIISSLQDGQSITLTVLDGCETTGTSCAPVSTAPEPATLLLLGSGLLGIAPFVRTKFGAA